MNLLERSSHEEIACLSTQPVGLLEANLLAPKSQFRVRNREHCSSLTDIHSHRQRQGHRRPNRFDRVWIMVRKVCLPNFLHLLTVSNANSSSEAT